jgi:hypothetical protein
MEWQPIETAPKDFSAVILYDPETRRNNQVGEGYYAPEEYDADDLWHWSSDNSIAYPTHWMPLPAAPVSP